ncbi:hypothetical protein [Bradyrhizobium sp. CCGUVB23]|uniref:hypothetical protein n=1 Tax=Bradyrhizobium sp. CCGUVB23 TaxID=2949630 RepID=UPI0020B361AC|nr:hypothetical protein [Bradyrhizobium sp. CCGUVB23]MCP3459760.1 hypothetical protein [Bradyrhizobium sp. CCGUVB23]
MVRIDVAALLLRQRCRAGEGEQAQYAKTLRLNLIEFRHLPVEKIAYELTRRKVATPHGGRWHGRKVARLLDRLHLR